jgi:hypothetical protein
MILALFLQLAAAPAFDFAHYASLPSGQAFEIQSAGRTIGRGRIIQKSARRFSMEFAIEAGGQSGQGRMELAFKSIQARSILLDAVYSGKWNNQPEKARETVQADRFLAENGVLAFRFLSKARFFQLAMSKSGETTVSTDWGTGRLVRRPQ